MHLLLKWEECLDNEIPLSSSLHPNLHSCWIPSINSYWKHHWGYPIPWLYWIPPQPKLWSNKPSTQENSHRPHDNLAIQMSQDFSLYLPHIQQVTLTLTMITTVACQPVLPTQFIIMLTLLLTQIALNPLHWIPMPLTLHSKTTRPSLLQRSYQITMKWNSLVNYKQKLKLHKGEAQASTINFVHTVW